MAAATHHKIPDDVADVLRNSTVEGDRLYLPNQLDRDLYLRTNKILTAIGGKWHKGAKAHLFARPVADVLVDALGAGKVANEKNIRQAFYTPPEYAAQLVQELNLSVFDNPRILEPSCGHGNLLQALKDSGVHSDTIHAYEIDPTAAEAARKQFPHVSVYEKDFLSVPSASFYYDVILMNPPFTKGQYLTHLEHALTFLAEGRVSLAAIMPSSLMGESKKDQEMMNLLNANYMEVITRALPRGAFKESGTMVETCMLVVRS